MKSEHERLIASAANLVALGKEVEAAREELKRLVAKDVPYDSDEMRNAYQHFAECSERWKEMERHHLALRDEIKGKNRPPM